MHGGLEEGGAGGVGGVAAGEAEKTFAAQAKYRSRLGFGGDSDLRRTVQGRDFDLSAERRRRETDRHFAVQVVVIALKNRMRLNLDLHVKVACRAAIYPGLAFA